MLYSAVAFEPAPRNHVEAAAGRDPVEDLHQGMVSLMAHDDVDEVLAKRFRRKQAGMPSSEYYRSLRLLDRTRRLAAIAS